MRLPFFVLAAALTLTGCTSGEPNETACAKFAKATDTWIPSIEQTPEAWEAELDRIELIARSAEGEVRTRMLSAVQESPGFDDVRASRDSREQVNALVDEVARACVEDGYSLEVNSYSN